MDVSCCRDREGESAHIIGDKQQPVFPPSVPDPGWLPSSSPACRLAAEYGKEARLLMLVKNYRSSPAILRCGTALLR